MYTDSKVIKNTKRIEARIELILFIVLGLIK
jgi:hypothetical protein